MIASQLVNGLVSGSIYGLLAIGLSLIYGIMHKLHFAHGEVFMLGAYISLVQTTLFGVPYLGTIPLTMLACAVLGVVIERIVFRPLNAAAPLQSLVAALGSAIFLQYAAVAIFEAKAQRLYSPFTEIGTSIFGVGMSYQKIIIVVVAFAVTVGLEVVSRRSRIGKVVRATTQDSEVAQSLGVNHNQIAVLIFASGSALAGLAGVLIAPLAYVDPFIGASIAIKAFIAVILGGFGSIAGTMLAAMLIGLIEAVATGLFSVSNRDLMTFSVLLLLLLLRPSGLLGRGA